MIQVPLTLYFSSLENSKASVQNVQELYPMLAEGFLCASYRVLLHTVNVKEEILLSHILQYSSHNV